MTPECARGCTLRNQHTTDCPDDDCGGCLPRPADHGHLCERCYTTLRDHLAAIPELAAHAAARTDGRLNTPTAPNTGGTTPGIAHVSPSPAWDTAEETVQWAHAWAEATADTFGHAGPFRYLRNGLPARDLHTTVGYLLAQLERVVEDEWMAVDLSDEARQHRRRLERAAGRDELTHRLRERCPTCDQRSLVREDGSDRVECKGCGRLWTEEEYRHLAHVAAS